jgi:hypothetical protein
MYSEMSFDTHKHIKEFIRAGMPELQAEAIVELIHKSRDYDLSKLATRDQIILLNQKIESSRAESKSDIESLGSELDQKIEFSRAESKSDIERLEQKIGSLGSELDQKIEFSRAESKSDIERVDRKIGSLGNELNQRISNIEGKMSTKDDLLKLENQMITIFKGLEVQIAKQDSQQKSWMIGIFLSMAAMAVTLILKLH